jgi:hypothetical protein
MTTKLDQLFRRGEDLLEYGSDSRYPFNSSASTHWRLNARRVLHIAHCLWVLQQSDDSVFDDVMTVLGGGE